MSYEGIQHAFEKALARSVKVSVNNKTLLPHERELYSSEELQNVTHKGSSAIWLERKCSAPSDPSFVNVYRPMGDKEILYLIEHGTLPDTQPYQAIMKGPEGRIYADKYLNGKKWTDTHPTTVVEFTMPVELIEQLESIQTKAEDGCVSMGLGHKAGKGLPLFNQALENRTGSFRIVKVKRQLPKQKNRA